MLSGHRNPEMDISIYFSLSLGSLRIKTPAAVDATHPIPSHPGTVFHLKLHKREEKKKKKKKRNVLLTSYLTRICKMKAIAIALATG